MSSYSIYISNTSSRSEEVKVNDNMNKTRTFPFHVHEYVLNHPVIVGRYVILSNAKDSLQICEVEILGKSTIHLLIKFYRFFHLKSF